MRRHAGKLFEDALQMVRTAAHGRGHGAQGDGTVEILFDVVTDALHQLGLRRHAVDIARMTALAGAKARAFGSGRVGKETNLLAARTSRWTRGLAVNACRLHRVIQRTVEARIAVENRGPRNILLGWNREFGWRCGGHGSEVLNCCAHNDTRLERLPIGNYPDVAAKIIYSSRTLTAATCSTQRS